MRKIRTVLLALSAALLFLSGCAATTAEQPQREDDIVTVSFDYAKQEGYATNQFAVWIEDANGNLVKDTLCHRVYRKRRLRKAAGRDTRLGNARRDCRGDRT